MLDSAQAKLDEANRQLQSFKHSTAGRWALFGAGLLAGFLLRWVLFR